MVGIGPFHPVMAESRELGDGRANKEGDFGGALTSGSDGIWRTSGGADWEGKGRGWGTAVRQMGLGEEKLLDGRAPSEPGQMWRHMHGG